MKKFVIIDGNAIIHRSYHALPKTLRSREGQLTNAVYGFTGILLGILETEKPEYVGVAFDMRGPTFRHEVLDSYKGTRAKTDDELIQQFPRVRSVIEAFNIPIFERPGFEADDYLGIISTLVEHDYNDIETLIITNDQDALQLVSERTTVVAPVKGYSEVKRYDREAVFSKLSVWPEQVPDYKGLCGDSSDNIKGVPGVGPKKAVALLNEYKTVEGIYDQLEAVEPEKLRELLRAHEEDARLSKHVATILREDAELKFKLDDCAVHDFNIDEVRAIFEELNFNKPMRRAEALNRAWEEKRESEKQVSLF